MRSFARLPPKSSCFSSRRAAHADATLFLGVIRRHQSPVVGGALGVGLPITCPSSSIVDHTETGAPALKAGNGNRLRPGADSVFSLT